MPFIYSFVMEVSFGKWNLRDWNTWKISKDSKLEKWFDITNNFNSTKEIVSDENISNLNNSHFMLVFKIILLVIIIVLFLFICFKWVYYWFKCKWWAYLLRLSSRDSSISHSKFSNETITMGIKIDSPQLRKTSLQSSIRMKVDEEIKE